MSAFDFVEPQTAVWMVTSLAHLLWQGFLIAGLALVAAQFLHQRSAQARYCAYCAAMFLIACCLPLNLYLFAPTEEFSDSSAVQIFDSQLLATLAEDATPGKVTEMETPPLNDAIAQEVLSEAATPSNPNALELSFWTRASKWMFSFYLAGIACMALRLLMGLYACQQLRASARPVSDARIVEVLDRLGRQIGMRMLPLVAHSTRVTTPMVVGVLKPAILLPVAILNDMSLQQVESLLLHELAHIRRYDHLVNLLQRIIETILFFHPAVWWLSHKVSVEREHCCDDLALAWGSEPCDYAETLVRASELRLQSAGLGADSAAALAATGRQPSALHRRVLRVLGLPLPGPNPGITRRGLAVLLVLVMAASGSLFVQGDQEPTPLVESEEEETVSDPESKLVFKDLRFDIPRDTEFSSAMLPATIKQFDGQRVTISGYMFPTAKRSGNKQFLLVRDNMEAFPRPIHDNIVVTMTADQAVDYTFRPVSVTGKFSIEEFNVGEGRDKLKAIYAIEATKVEPHNSKKKLQTKESYLDASDSKDRLIPQPEVIADRSIVVPVTTELQRSLLGLVGEPNKEVTLCVLINANAYDSPDEVSAQSTDSQELLKVLKNYPPEDQRMVRIRMLDDMQDGKTFDEREERMEALNKLANDLGKAAGFSKILSSNTYGADWKRAMHRARDSSTTRDDADELALVETAKLRVYQVTSFLSRFLVNADCVVEVLPIVRDADGARFREDILPAVANTVGQLDLPAGKNLLIRIRMSKTMRREISDWISDIPGRRAYAERLGFELCNISKSAIAESEEVAEVTEPRQDRWGKAVDGVRVRLTEQQYEIAQGSSLDLKVDFENKGTIDHRIMIEAENWELEIDGKWLTKPGWHSGWRESLELRATESQRDVEVLLWDNIRQALANLEPGKHTIRVARHLRTAAPAIRVISQETTLLVTKTPRLQVRVAQLLDDPEEVKAAQERGDQNLIAWQRDEEQHEWLMLDVKRAVLFTEEDVVEATAVESVNKPHYEVRIKLNDTAAKRMRQVTSELVKQGQRDPNLRLPILLDGKVLMAPRLLAIMSSDLAITGNFTRKEAEEITQQIKPPRATQLYNGIYRADPNNSSKNGAEVQASNKAGLLRLLNRLTDNIGTPTMVSTNNDNTQFRVTLKSVGPFPKNEKFGYTAAMIDGICVWISGHSAVDEQECRDMWVSLKDRRVAERVAAKLGVSPQLRKHPGHKMHVQLTPTKQTFSSDEPIIVKLTIKNIGDHTFTFLDGGKQRGARNNQFRFTAHSDSGNSPELPDIGDAMHFGGLAAHVMLKPGETFSKEVNLTKWFDFSVTGTYKIDGNFDLEINRGERREFPMEWDDVAKGQCLVAVKQADKPEVTSLTTRVVSTSGKPFASSYVTLWRALDPEETDPRNTVNGTKGFGYYNPVIWEDAKNKVRWVREASGQPNGGRPRPEMHSFRFDQLQPGRYRVTAVPYDRASGVPDPTPYGFSDALELSSGEDRNLEVRLQSGSSSLNLTVVDAQTRKPVSGLAVRLRTASGMPIVHGHGSGNFFEWTGNQGEVRYGQLTPGEYTVQVLGKQASVNNFVEYEPMEVWLSTTVEAGENVFEVAVPPRKLRRAEIDKRFPFSVFGQVTDQLGNPMADVKVRAATGIGTLLGGGSTTTDAAGMYRLYFGPGMRTGIDKEYAPHGVGVQATHFFAEKPGWELDAEDGYLFYLMTDQTPEQFKAMLKERGGKYWGKDSAEEVVFAGESRELDLLLKKDDSPAMASEKIDKAK